MNRYPPNPRPFADAPPAIVQEAKRNCAWYKNEIKRLSAVLAHNSTEYAKVVQEFKEGETWKQEYKTWGSACREVLDISPQRAHQLMGKLTELYATDLSTPLDNGTHDKESAELNEVKQLREPKPQEPDTDKEEDEKPAVHSADEVKAKPASNGHVKPIKNGTPKRLLPIWGELEVSLGRCLNRADELNRHCPNRRLHAEFIMESKSAMEVLEKWRASV